MDGWRICRRDLSIDRQQLTLPRDYQPTDQFARDYSTRSNGGGGGGPFAFKFVFSRSLYPPPLPPETAVDARRARAPSPRLIISNTRDVFEGSLRGRVTVPDRIIRYRGRFFFQRGRRPETSLRRIFSASEPRGNNRGIIKQHARKGSCLLRLGAC